MTDYPSESSLVVNATQQQLSGGPFTGGVAISPSQREEAKGGYDIAFETATRLELQYKAVYSEIDDRSFDHRYKQTAVKFPFNGSQAKTLLGRQTAPGTAFYALPVITDVSDLGDILGKTLFLDVFGLWSLPKSLRDLDEYTAFWEPVKKSEENGIKKDYEPTFSGLYLKDGTERRYSKPCAYHRIESEYLYTWEELKAFTSSSITGVPLRINGESQAKAGYQELLSFERQLLKSRLPEYIYDGQEPEQADYENYVYPAIKDISQRSIEVGETIQSNREDRTQLKPETQEALNEHPYLSEPKFDREQRLEAVKASLLSRSDEGGPQFHDEGLDPRQGSRYRQYRFLTSGRDTDKTLRVPIGFARELL